MLSKKVYSTAMIVMMAASGGAPVMAQETFDWRAHDGTDINVMMSRHPWQEAIEPFIPEFEELTGITVNLTKLPEQQFMTRVAADLTSGTFSQDVFMTQYYDAPTFQAEGWTADLQPYLDAAEAAGYDWEDFFPAARDVSSIGGSYVDRIAITSEAQVLVYRTDILDDLGIEVPSTFDELAAAAERISEETDFAGFTLRGGASNWWPFYGYVRSFGGDYVTVPDLEPVIDTPDASAALAMYDRLAATAPRGVTSYDWDEINTAMLSGQAAMFLDSSVIFARLQNPELSNVVGKVGIAPMVAGPAGPVGHSHFWSISLSATAPQPEAGWYFIQWATSPEMQGRIALEGVLGARASSWEVDGLDAVFPAEFIDAVKTSLDTAVISPANLKFFELMDPLRVQIQEAIMDNVEPASALEGVQEEWARILQ
ncbi:ABC transporter substrate-binding protein [Flavimaricola marinus]|uniref:Putative ABC transporter-binding protein n=1 Tax=Flavimaricola marinus TaxID=1819565 RepID=A0A238LJR0_9RHOB|nr:sugar ABC transporter substrate-binding protein [Flavimaricola marinus]SMY09773.1 putative ABC transporter-binding protein precursor [Flavimaricola marinus]